MMETTFQKIIRKTGMKPSSCKCRLCASQCLHPCIGTPEDMQKIIDAGYSDRVAETIWAVGKLMGVLEQDVLMIAPKYDQQKRSCTFLSDGLCELHDKGLKPTEGKLSHHSTRAETFNPKKSIGLACAKEWIPLTEKQIEGMNKQKE